VHQVEEQEALRAEDTGKETQGRTHSAWLSEQERHPIQAFWLNNIAKKVQRGVDWKMRRRIVERLAVFEQRRNFGR
jgi:hypothetical protein